MVSSSAADDHPDVVRRLVIHSCSHALGEAAVLLLPEAEEERREADAALKQLVKELVVQL
jgi:hypothetical protein